ncbi:MAG TPA: SusC/RagA family TonB-linked outer membrane protein, partial [Arachidicoccus sp.]|nr:SusC/RagA family TonB-linked outer membrane protein [Arachidicoccus sp.]
MQSLNRRLEPLLSIKKHGIHAKQLWSALKLKLILVIMLAFNLQTQAKAFAQHLSIDMKNADLRAVFKQIKAQTGYDFFYNESMTKHARPVTLRVKNQPLKTVLDLCFRDQPFTYAVVKKLIVVKNKTIPPEENEPPAAVKPAVRFLEIEGTVSDSTGVALSGVSVLNSKTRRGTFTNPQGHYVIAATAGDVLEFSYIGYDTKSVTVADETQIDIQLVQSTSTLSDLIVVGYGTQKKEDLTGAVSVLKSEQLENRPVTSVGNALQGTMPGVAVTSAVTGQPGNDAGTIRVRGVGTLNNSDAMVVVDGVISSMNNVNPDDIASISVLKDAASAAIYGSRAANGVILITTKRGKNAAPKISYSGYLGKQSATALPDFLPSWQAASLYNQALKNEGKQARWTDEEVQKFKSGSDPYNFPNTDWLGLFYKGSGIQQNHYVSVTGGNDNTQYAFSAGLFDQKGIVDKTEAKRYTTRFNINTTLSQHLTASGSLAFTYSGKGEPSNPYTSEFTQLVRQINRISPIIPYKFENGNYGHISDGNPMAWLEGKSFAAYKNYDLVANGGLDWEITKGLHFKPSIAYVMGALHEKHFTADQQYYNVDGSPSFYQGPNSVKDVNHFNNVVTFQDLLEYTKAFGDHHFKALGGYSQEYTKFTYDDGFRKGLLNNDLSDINLGSTDGQTTSGYTYDLGLRSFFGRINYDFDNKYLFEANIRYDGSSRFAPDKRWFVFPSFSAGWNLDKETFFESLKPVFSSLKLRGSWGKLGNQNVVVSGGTIDQTYYPYIPVIATGQNYTFGGTAPDIASGIAPITGANP